MDDAHVLIRSALATVSRLNTVLSQMKEHSAVSAIPEPEVPVLESNLAYLWSIADPSKYELRASEIVSMAEIPDLGQLTRGRRVEVNKLLSLRESTECQAFRRFVRSSGEQDLQELKEAASSIRSKLGSGLKSSLGKKIFEPRVARSMASRRRRRGQHGPESGAGRSLSDLATGSVARDPFGWGRFRATPPDARRRARSWHAR